MVAGTYDIQSVEMDGSGSSTNIISRCIAAITNHVQSESANNDFAFAVHYEFYIFL